MSSETLSNGVDDDFEPASDSTETQVATVPQQLAGQRLDQAVVEMFPGYSRSKLQQWIKDGMLVLDGREAKPKSKLVGGELISLTAVLEPQGEWLAEAIPLDIVHEDTAILVINKPAGLVVHPAAGNYSGTLLNGLLHYNPFHRNLPRAGIVHRLDKDTSGLMVVAKTEAAQNHLVNQMQARTVKRRYEALAMGHCVAAGEVNAPIGRHPSQRTRMAVVRAGGKEAITHYTPVARFDGITHLSLQLQTGRTHQIRVHMAHIGLPLVGDPVYGKPFPGNWMKAHPHLQDLATFKRQALHAVELGLIHPDTGESMRWQVPMAEDMAELLALLRSNGGAR